MKWSLQDIGPDNNMFLYISSYFFALSTWYVTRGSISEDQLSAHVVTMIKKHCCSQIIMAMISAGPDLLLFEISVYTVCLLFLLSRTIIHTCTWWSFERTANILSLHEFDWTFTKRSKQPGDIFLNWWISRLRSWEGIAADLCNIKTFHQILSKPS